MGTEIRGCSDGNVGHVFANDRREGSESRVNTQIIPHQVSCNDEAATEEYIFSTPPPL